MSFHVGVNFLFLGKKAAVFTVDLHRWPEAGHLCATGHRFHTSTVRAALAAAMYTLSERHFEGGAP